MNAVLPVKGSPDGLNEGVGIVAFYK
jgi:hypothetical protein